jgi:hypothetical protein
MSENANKIFAKNFSVLSDVYEYSENDIKNIYPLEDTKSGHKTYKLENVYIHSKYDPVKEAKRAIDLLLENTEDVDVYILFGCGLGYTIHELYNRILANNPKQIKPYIIWIENDLKSFMSAVNCLDLSDILADSNVKIFIEAKKDVIGSFLQTIPTKRIRYYYHRPLYTFYEAYFKEVQNYISYVLDRKDMNSATLVRFQKIWARNIIFNTPYYPFAGKIESLRNIAKGCNALVIAGGPTLEQMLPYIKEERENLILIAVDTAYKFLRSNGITPEIVVSVDPQYWNYKYLENETLEDSILITDPSAYFKVFRNIPTERIFTGNSLFELTGYFMKNENRGTLAAGGSVATTAFDIARLIGVEKIILAGLDLGFPGRNTHFKGAFFENNFISTAGYFDDAQQKSFNYLMHTGELPLTQSTDKKTIITDPKMILFRKWIEREVGLTNIPVLLPNLGGSLIEGCKIVELSDLPHTKVDKDSYNIKIQTIINENKKNTVPYYVCENMKTFSQISKTITEESEKILKLIPENANMPQNKINEFDMRQKKLMDQSEKNKVLNIISSSAQNILLSIMENVSYSDDSQKSVWLKIRKLYEAINEMSIFYEKNFQKVLKVMNVPPKIKSDVL